MTATLQYLDPTLIDISSYSGRHQSAFRSARFANLRRSIAHGAGNAIPVFARPEVDDRYTLGYGMLRLPACREFGLPVLAIVETVDEVSFFVRGQLENNADSMSAYERGTSTNELGAGPAVHAPEEVRLNWGHSWLRRQ